MRALIITAAEARGLLAGSLNEIRRTVRWPAWVDDIERAANALSMHGALGYFVEGSPRKTFACPLGAAGDRLWCREAWGFRGTTWCSANPDDLLVRIGYQADGEIIERKMVRADEPKLGLPTQPKPRKHESEFHYGDRLTDYWRSWRSPVSMPRWASRLTVEVTSVRVERTGAEWEWSVEVSRV